jgi:hypothetical protein
MVEEKIYYDATTIRGPSSGRKPVILCEEKICEIQQYIGVHCDPQENNRCLQYCFLMTNLETQTNRFVKLNLERKNSTLLFILPPYHYGSNFSKLLHECFSMHNEPLINIRSKVMFCTNMFLFDSMRQLMEGIEYFNNCSSYSIVLEDL